MNLYVYIYTYIKMYEQIYMSIYNILEVLWLREFKVLTPTPSTADDGSSGKQVLSVQTGD